MKTSTDFVCRVVVSDFAKKKYLKSLDKENRRVFSKLWFAFELMLKKPEKLLKKAHNEIIHDNGDVVICKCYFKSELKKSAKSAGGRAIIAWHKKERIVRVLLVYKKKHIVGSHETAWWEGVISKNYPEYKELF